MMYPFSRVLKILCIRVSVFCYVHAPGLVSVQHSRDANIFMHVHMLVNMYLISDESTI